MAITVTNEELIHAVRVWQDMECSVRSKFSICLMKMMNIKTLRKMQTGRSSIPYSMIELQLMTLRVQLEVPIL